MLSLSDRFWSHVDKDGPVPDYAPHLGQCWLWTASKTDGYGMFKVEGRMRPAQRVSYLLAGRTIPKGCHVDHLCRVRACVNPNHLEAVTVKENIHRSPIHNANKTHCKHGHLLSGYNAMPVTGGKTCRECFNAGSRRRYKENPRQVLDRQKKRRQQHIGRQP